MNEDLNYFVAARNTRVSAALDALALVNLINSVGRSWPATVHLWNLLPSGVFSGGALFNSAMNFCLLRV